MLTNSQSKVLWMTLLVVAVGKISLFLSIGMVHRPDSADYIGFADAILRSREWFDDANIQILDFTAFRSLGYPMVIAFAKIVSPEYWMTVLFAFQLSLTFVSCWALYRLAVALTSNAVFGAFVVLAHAFSQLMVLDQTVLTDSINAALLVTAFSLLGHDLILRRPITTARTLLLAILITSAFLMREAGAILQYTIWPMLLVAVLTGGGTWVRAVLLLVVFATPMVLTKHAYKGWNEYRTGVSFVTLGAATTMYRPVVDLARRGVPVYDEDRYLSDIPGLLETAHDTPGQSYFLMRSHLRDEHGFDMVDVGRYGYEQYLKHWLKYPLERAAIFISKINESVLFSPLMPFKAHDRLLMTADVERFYPGSSEALDRVFNFDLKLIAFLAGLVIARVVSSLICATYLFGLPFVFIRSLMRTGIAGVAGDSRLCFLATGWLLFLGYLVAYALVHLETRYLLPVLPILTVIGGHLLIEGLRIGIRRLPIPMRSTS